VVVSGDATSVDQASLRRNMALFASVPEQAIQLFVTAGSVLLVFRITASSLDEALRMQKTLRVSPSVMSVALDAMVEHVGVVNLRPALGEPPMDGVEEDSGMFILFLIMAIIAVLVTCGACYLFARTGGEDDEEGPYKKTLDEPTP